MSSRRQTPAADGQNRSKLRNILRRMKHHASAVKNRRHGGGKVAGVTRGGSDALRQKPRRRRAPYDSPPFSSAPLLSPANDFGGDANGRRFSPTRNSRTAYRCRPAPSRLCAGLNWYLLQADQRHSAALPQRRRRRRRTPAAALPGTTSAAVSGGGDVRCDPQKRAFVAWRGATRCLALHARLRICIGRTCLALRAATPGGSPGRRSVFWRQAAPGDATVRFKGAGKHHLHFRDAKCGRSSWPRNFGCASSSRLSATGVTGIAVSCQTTPGYYR